MQVVDGSLDSGAYEKITGLSAVKGITLNTGTLKANRLALIKVESQPVRWRADGIDPSATDGMLIDVGDEYWYNGPLEKIKFIETAASATLHVHLFR